MRDRLYVGRPSTHLIAVHNRHSLSEHRTPHTYTHTYLLTHRAVTHRDRDNQTAHSRPYCEHLLVLAHAHRHHQHDARNLIRTRALTQRRSLALFRPPSPPSLCPLRPFGAFNPTATRTTTPEPVRSLRTHCIIATRPLLPAAIAAAVAVHHRHINVAFVASVVSLNIHRPNLGTCKTRLRATNTLPAPKSPARRPGRHYSGSVGRPPIIGQTTAATNGRSHTITQHIYIYNSLSTTH